MSHNTLLTKQGIQVEKEWPVFHFSKGLEVRAWPVLLAME
jgi:uncharacterized protein